MEAIVTAVVTTLATLGVVGGIAFIVLMFMLGRALSKHERSRRAE